MTAKKTDYIILYCFLLASILCIALLARLFVIKELQMDDFSGVTTFVVACLLLGGLYFSFQSILNDILLPAVERIFRKSQPLDSQPMEIATQTQLTLSEPTVTTSQYGDYRQTAQQKIQQEQEQILENVLAYTYRELALYIKENDLQLLHEHIRFFQHATEDECKQIKTSVTVDTKLKSIDLMHFGWNVGNQFKKSGIETATFIKQVFAKDLNDSVISTIKRKLRAEGTCIIKIKEEL